MHARQKQLLSDYLNGSAKLAEAVQGMTLEQLHSRPIKDKWTTMELVCHLADFEPVFADRMKRVIALEQPMLLGADENQFARHLAYQDRNITEEIALINLVRSQMARILNSIPEDFWLKTGVHSEKGPLSLEKLLEKAVGHIDHHLPFIAEKRRAFPNK